MRPSLEALTAEFRAIVSRKAKNGETFESFVIEWWRMDGVDVDAIMDEFA